MIIYLMRRSRAEEKKWGREEDEKEEDEKEKDEKQEEEETFRSI